MKNPLNNLFGAITIAGAGAAAIAGCGSDNSGTHSWVVKKEIQNFDELPKKTKDLVQAHVMRQNISEAFVQDLAQRYEKNPFGEFTATEKAVLQLAKKVAEQIQPNTTVSFNNWQYVTLGGLLVIIQVIRSLVEATTKIEIEKIRAETRSRAKES